MHMPYSSNTTIIITTKCSQHVFDKSNGMDLDGELIFINKQN
jgi:hypothetical protein